MGWGNCIVSELATGTYYPQSMTSRVLVLGLVLMLMLVVSVVQDVVSVELAFSTEQNLFMMNNCTGYITVESYVALQSLYNATAGWNWRWDRLLPSSTKWHFPSSLASPCSDSWQGLACVTNLNGSMCEIETISLTDFNLEGTIPTELGNVVSMQRLYLNFNSLEGTIPTELGNIVDMQIFDLNFNLLEGTIPTELGSIVGMQILGLYSNSLEGTIPTELGNIVGMKILDLHSNLLEGTIPTELGNIVGMQYLYLYSNALEGTIPTELGDVVGLQYLYLYSNSLEGTIPTELGNIVGMQILGLNSNSLEGTIPTELGNIVGMQILSLNSNSLEGTIPTELGNIVGMQLLDLYSSSLEGTIPTELGNVVGMQILGLNSNSLEGTIPTELGNMVDMEVLYLFSNSLVGTIPTQLGNLVRLEDIDFNSNLFVGSLAFLTNMSRLRLINIGGNLFSGTLPSAIEGMLRLEYLNLSSNRLSGSIDMLVKKNLSLASVFSVDLSKNYFTGTLPDALFVLKLLQTIILSQNCFSGTLPSSMCWNHNLENIVLDLLTGNCAGSTTFFQKFVLRQYMRGTIPACIWKSSSIHVLHLLGNGLMGSVADLSATSQLSVLALGSNQLTGTIPKTFQHHNFEQLDLSINRLSGTLESDLWLNQTVTVYDLSVNRLSGGIPSSLYGEFAAGVLNILEGNLFDCQQSDVPASDLSHESYECGSVNFQYSFFAWVAGFSCVLIVVFGAFVWKTRFVGVMSRVAALLGVLAFPLACAAVSLSGLVVYVGTKLPDELHTATHAVQYWWTATATFSHGWQICILAYLLLAMSCVVFALTILSFARGNGLSGIASAGTVSVASKGRISKLVGVHLINVVAVVVVNGAYILVAVDNIGGFALLAVQMAVAGFKLGWSTIAIPWLLSRTVTDSSMSLSHWMLMILFVFLGAPFASTFCESSSCFLYVLTSPQPIGFTFVIPTQEVITQCLGDVCFSVTAPLSQPVYGNISPPWIYSYQCSSAVLTSYAPVLLLSYLMSGMVSPVVRLALSEFSPTQVAVVKKALPFMVPEMTFLDKPSAEILLNNGAVSKLVRKLMVKYILNLAVLLTFGLAVPILSVAVICDIAFNVAVAMVLLERFIQRCEQNNLDAGKLRLDFWDRFVLSTREASGCIYIVLGYVSVFWSLFAFDWVADVYGSLPGGLAMLVPLLMPTMIGFTVLRMKIRRSELTISRHKSDDIELMQIGNPVRQPQSTCDNFDSFIG